MKRILLVVAVSILSILTSFFFSSCTSSSPAENAQNQLASIELPVAAPKISYGLAVDSLEVVEARLKINESLGEILSRYNVSASAIAEIAQLPKELFNVRRLMANKPYTIIHGKDSLKSAKKFIYHPNPIDYVALDFSDSVSVEKGRHPVDTIEHTLSGRIDQSLYQAIIDGNGPPALVHKLASVYAWEIDFFGLVSGDFFHVVYESYEVEGQNAGLGDIKAALFNHAEKDLYAFAFDEGKGGEYFDENGNNLRKAFLKAPLRYSRISSKFSYSRLHPILKIRRPHLGVDYAAPRGTQVVAVADGTVTKANYSGGAGRMIKLRHNGNCETGYLHLSRFAKGIKPGVYVSQGDVIGYVGSSGLSTGPHLDYRVWQNGVAVDPLSIEPASGDPVSDDLCDQYFEKITPFKKKLDKIKRPKSKDLLATVE